MSRRLRTIHTPRVYFGDVIYEPGGCFGPRAQLDYQLVVLIAGEASVTIDGRAMALAADQVALLCPGHSEVFRFSDRRPTHHTWCAIDPGLVPDELAQSCARAAGALPLTGRMTQLMELGLSLPRAAGQRAPGLIEALGLAALNEYLYAGVSALAPEADEPDALRRALEWLGQHGSTAFDLRMLAREAGVSRAQLVKLFKRHLRVTPMRYVWEMRTRQGMRLLRDTGLTVSEVAARCGFSTPFHFSRWVRAMAGVAPREFRARAWTPGK